MNCQPSKSRWLGREARRYSRGTFLAKGLSDFTQENGSRTASICRVSIRTAIYLDKPGKINTVPRANVSSSFDPRTISLTTKWDDFRKTLEDNRLNVVKRQRDEGGTWSERPQNSRRKRRAIKRFEQTVKVNVSRDGIEPGRCSLQPNSIITAGRN